jgi:hypothetical protein
MLGIALLVLSYSSRRDLIRSDELASYAYVALAISFFVRLIADGATIANIALVSGWIPNRALSARAAMVNWGLQLLLLCYLTTAVIFYIGRTTDMRPRAVTSDPMEGMSGVVFAIMMLYLVITAYTFLHHSLHSAARQAARPSDTKTGGGQSGF